jgi:hypothetical protein
MSSSKKLDMSYVQSCIENEGFTYCFDSYSSFKEVKDDSFHKLLSDYKVAKKRLENYINKKAELEDNSIKNK